MLELNIPEQPKEPEKRTLEDVIEDRAEGVYRILSGAPRRRIYVNCIGQFFIFKVTFFGNTVMVNGDDRAWLSETVQKTDEKITVSFTEQ